ncbi:MAG: 50S ribosomal protein L3 [Prosthecobacter sp.]|jgi:large subunit ribosomal protein L3|uniref:50S ribosomal protein L3 n=1 Tax=Prosthecobacter sp. TaxID=1965333 RepID=UPI0025EC3E76|nr:50S ribosomal protein L3 [Prosthecobacter sp.]MCF7785900.1 50S ribosomal protein L3 [Prosthecobacter sp.]MCX6852639.1 50S ribosomal protein L3 [Verrucomicrobiota bacterium]
MSLGLIGKKLGMTKVYDAKGDAISVTVVDVSGNTILQVKRSDGKDKYSAVQVGYGDQLKDSRVTKPLLGHFKKHGCTTAKRIVKEFRLTGDDQLPAADAKLDASIFSNGQVVDVIGNTKGKGFQGVVKRWNFAGQPATHGHMMHRRPGSIGCRLTPGLVWKNQKMPGHDGTTRCTTQNLVVVQSRPEEGILLIKGALPGNKGSIVVVRPGKKAVVKK